MVEIGFYDGCIHINPSPALDIDAIHQHGPGQGHSGHFNLKTTNWRASDEK